MKILRGIYLWICYITGIPVLLAIGIPVFLVISITSKIQYGTFGLKELWVGLLDGAKEGHKTNMIFVKYGRKGYQSEIEL